MEEGNVIVVLNPDLLNVPYASDFPPSLDGFGESFHLEDIEEQSPIALTVSGGITPEMPIVFPGMSFASGSKVSIPSSPFSISQAGGCEPSPTFPTQDPLIVPSRVSPALEESTATPLERIAGISTQATTNTPLLVSSHPSTTLIMFDRETSVPKEVASVIFCILDIHNSSSSWQCASSSCQGGSFRGPHSHREEAFNSIVCNLQNILSLVNSCVIGI